MSEIELILAKLRIVSEEKERGMYLCDKEHSKLLYDYITNLQQENKQLKEEKNKLEQAFIELYEENQKLFNHLMIDKILKGDPNDKTNKENN